MNKNKSLSINLRSAAEAQLAITSPPPINPTGKQLHELQVHQIELEMQNEELRRTQVALDRERARYFDLYDLAPVGYVTINDAGLVLQANFMACTLLGVTRGALIRQPISRFMLREDGDIFYLLRKQIIASGESRSCELRILKNDGTPLWVALTASPAQGEDGVPELWIVLNDITQRKQTETALRKSEAFSLAILDSVLAEIAVLDREGVILAVNQAWQTFSLANSVEPGTPALPTKVGVNYLAVCRSSNGVASEEALRASKGIRAVLDGVLPVFNLEYTCHSPLRQCWFNMSVTPLGPDRRGVVVAHTNITERKQAEAELRIAAVAFEGQEGILVMDANKKVLRVNQAFTQISGYSQQEAQENRNAHLKSGQYAADFYQAIWREINQNGVWQGEIWHQRKNGADYLAQVGATAVKNELGQVTHYVINFTDVTLARQQEQERLLREVAQRDMLVREVHHRIKNNLQGITGLLRQFVQKHPNTADPVNQAISQVQGISIIYGLQGSSVASTVRLCELIQAVAAQIQALWQTLVTLDIPPAWQALVVAENEAVPIALVINELIVNAVKHGGKAQGDVHISLQKGCLPDGVQIRMANVGQFARDGESAGARHSGLKLVSALMPRTGARLSVEQNGEQVITLLELAPPVIFYSEGIR